MRPLAELLSSDSAFPLIQQWVSQAVRPCELLPPAENRSEVLHRVQVTTHSTLGALAYETGGLLIDGGWLRFLGSGHPRLCRNLPDWNRDKAQGIYLVADDAIGGFFAINGGVLGNDVQLIYYWAPERLEWESLNVGFSEFLNFSLTGDLDTFYMDKRWPEWRDDVAKLSADCCYSFYPPLWTKEGSVVSSHRGDVPVEEAYQVQMDFRRQLGPA